LGKEYGKVEIENIKYDEDEYRKNNGHSLFEVAVAFLAYVGHGIAELAFQSPWGIDRTAVFVEPWFHLERTPFPLIIEITGPVFELFTAF
jgi:hypothetical protein